MTTIACDGKSMAGDGRCLDHWDTLVNDARQKVSRLEDGRIIGAAGNSFDAASWREWLVGGKKGDCPIQAEQFGGLILHPDGSILWVDHKGRETPTPAPIAIGSGQDYALGAMEAGVSAERAVQIAARRDMKTGGTITVLHLEAAK